MSTLDAQTRTRTRAQLGRLIDVFAITSLYVTHDQREAIALADRIAVMNQGNIVQIGTAGEVRRRPANVFVAQFIGSPAMNILTGLFKKERLWFEGVTGGIDLPFTQQPLADGPILVGIRPENLLADPTGVLSMEVIQIERLLAQRAQLVYGEMAGQPLIAQVPAEVQAKPGLTLNLTVAVEDIHLFKYHDETRIW
jgi:ABC-type sugar transport system ATPase subunit